MQKKKSMNLNKDNIKILLCCHKPSTLPPDPDGIFLPIQVGAAISDTDLGMQRDDQLNGQPCDNISEKNKSYCELTAMYWAWKNIKKLYPNLEYIGLNHYRRLFFSQIRIPKGKIVVPFLEYYPFSVERQYKILHYSDDFDKLEDVVHCLTPDYVDSFNSKLKNGNKSTVFNMFIMPVSVFEKYCEWLFSILSTCEKAINISEYPDYQRRVFGFMAERLLFVFISKNKYPIKQVPVHTYEVQECSKLHRLINKVRYSFAYIISS